MSASPRPPFVPVGANPARLFGLEARRRACRLAENAGFAAADQIPSEGPVLLGNLDFAWDPAWLKEMGRRPDAVLVKNGVPVIAHLAGAARAAAVAGAMEQGRILEPAGLELLDADSAEISYFELRKRDRPFVLPLDSANAVTVERAYYDAAYKGVTDLLTLYLWRDAAFHLTRSAAKAGMTPNMVTAIGALFCLLAFALFWTGHHWLGVVAGLIFMVLDTVDGKLARCTGTSSKWGNLFDHGIDLVHPPFWWWAWAHGLPGFGTPLEPVYQSMLVAAVVIGYVGQRLVEGIFLRFYGMHIHVWEEVDSRFRLVSARRNPNMVILVASLLFGRPDVGLELITLWTWLSLIFHSVRLAQANARSDRGQPVISWLA